MKEGGCSLDKKSVIKENIRTKIKEWLAESEILKEVFAHYKGRNKELALIGDKVTDLILYKELYPKSIKGIMDQKRQKYFSRNNQAILFEKLGLKDFLIKQNQSPLNKKVKHTIFEAIFGALYLLKGMDSAVELLKNISHFMEYNLFD